MKYFSMFSGIGGFELGIEKAYDSITKRNKQRVRQRGGQNSCIKRFRLGTQQPTCIGFSEIDKYAIQIYQKHFPKHKNFGDATKIIPKELPDFDLLCGGFPCQSFSIAGKRKGFEDTRGTLFFEICRIARVKRPTYLFLENVRGLLSHDNGYTFLVILESLAELGYILQWQVLNSKDFGVPQNRERVFIIGHLAEASPPKVFPIKKNNRKNDKNKSTKRRKRSTISSLTSRYGQRWTDESYIKQRTGIMRKQFDVSGKGYNSQQDRVYHIEGIMASLPNAHPDNKLNIFTEQTIRRLTPIECERLQGFPDGWTENGIDENGNEVGMSDTQRYKCLGNAVTVNVIEAIMTRWLGNET